MECAAPGPHEGPTHTLVQQRRPRRSRMLNCARARAPVAPVNPNIKTSWCRKARMRMRDAHAAHSWNPLFSASTRAVHPPKSMAPAAVKCGCARSAQAAPGSLQERVPPTPRRPGAALKSAHKAIAMEGATPGPHQGPTHTLVQHRGLRRSMTLNCARARAPVAPVNPNIKISWCRKARMRELRVFVVVVPGFVVVVVVIPVSSPAPVFALP